MHPDAHSSANTSTATAVPIDLYNVLGVFNTKATPSELRQAFLVRARTVHPDKGGDPALFSQLQNAWEVLGNAQTRQAYDERCRVNCGRATAHVEIDLDEFHFDTTTGDFSRLCRCGATTRITEDQLDAGVDLVECPACSLCVRVLYELSEAAAAVASDDDKLRRDKLL